MNAANHSAFCPDCNLLSGYWVVLQSVDRRYSLRGPACFHIHRCIFSQQKVQFTYVLENTGLFKKIVGVLTTCYLVLLMQPHEISFYGVTSRIRFMFLLFPQVSQNWRYDSEPPLKPSSLTCYKQFGTNSIIVLMFVESQRVHIESTYRVWNKNLEYCPIK